MSRAATKARKLTWAAVQRLMAARYPRVPTVAASDLAAQIDGVTPPLLLDVRTKREFAVSHLPGARRVEPGSLPGDRLGLDRARPVVAYCSVGVRSAALVQALRRAGFGEAVNLDGGIFRWVGEGRPVVRDGALVHGVHPYDARWGMLLDAERHEYTPES